MQITTAQADQVVQIFGFDSLVDEYEQNELGHVYQLEDSTTLVIGLSGSAHHMNGDDQRLYGVDFEQVSETEVRYWFGRRDLGVIDFSATEEGEEPRAWIAAARHSERIACGAY